MSARVTRKRARTEEEENQAEQSENPKSVPVVEESVLLKRDEEFWLEDGTIILIARDIEFRVYSGLLAYHSPVLKEEFSKPHSKRSTLVPDGGFLLCPVVHLSDTPEDLRHLLRAYMPCKDYSLYVAKEPSFANISVSIRLGKKYKITPLYEQSLHHLRRHFPRDYTAWRDALEYEPPGWDGEETVGVINLARSIGELSILPAAFLVCMILDDDFIIHGFTGEDGKRETLTPENLATCLRGRTRVCQANIAHRLQILTYSPRCREPSLCRSMLKKALTALHTRVKTLMDLDVNTSHSAFLMDEKSNPLSVCKDCNKELSRRSWAESEKVWNLLPELLGIDIPGWCEVPGVEGDAS
ncbi:hypothetical protein C8Q80DRAFT_1238154 [Daedaleopsis nitida]|nr:hypothetical protein C8Q80DRAFT_1238154 [Daedaleopsis nitida]